MKKHNFQVGDRVILMTPPEIQSMVGLWFDTWRCHFGVEINRHMEKMCVSGKIWVIEEVRDVWLYIPRYYFPWEIVKHVDGKSSIQQRIRFIRK